MQLSLGIGLRDDATLDAFYPGENAFAISCLRQIADPRLQGEAIIYLYGDAGVGLSHLLQAACHEARLHRKSSAYLALDAFAQPGMLDGLEQVFMLCIDDLDAIAGRPDMEEAFFHCFNRCRAAGVRCVLAAKRLPNELGIRLPDLRSRLNQALVVQLKPLNEEGQVAALQGRAQARGLILRQAVAQFLVRRLDGSMHHLYNALERLDMASMQEKRALTLPFVKKILNI